jgi:hypothetical protein
MSQEQVLALYARTLHEIAAWQDGNDPNKLDEPASALKARAALEQTMPQGVLRELFYPETITKGD